MKIELTQHKSLGELNVKQFFCKGCGMLPASNEKCPHCENLSDKRHGLPSLLQILQTGEAIVFAIIAILVFMHFYNVYLK